METGVTHVFVLDSSLVLEVTHNFFGVECSSSAHCSLCHVQVMLGIQLSPPLAQQADAAAGRSADVTSAGKDEKEQGKDCTCHHGIALGWTWLVTAG